MFFNNQMIYELKHEVTIRRLNRIIQMINDNFPGTKYTNRDYDHVIVYILGKQPFSMLVDIWTCNEAFNVEIKGLFFGDEQWYKYQNHYDNNIRKYYNMNELLNAIKTYFL